MKPVPEEEAERWLRQALIDLSDAKFNRDGGRHHLACFVAQQAAEKATKAFLYAQGLEDVRGHAVGRLNAEATVYDSSLSELQHDSSSLDQYTSLRDTRTALPAESLVKLSTSVTPRWPLNEPNGSRAPSNCVCVTRKAATTRKQSPLHSRRLLFEVNIPNATTREAMAKLEACRWTIFLSRDTKPSAPNWPLLLVRLA